MSCLPAAVVLLIVGLLHPALAFSCLGGGGGALDWFIAIKVPTKSPAGEGVDYFYISSEQPDSWRSTPCANVDKCGPIYDTLAQLYTKAPENSTVSLRYNDQPPNRSPSSSTFGHMKGALAFSYRGSGFWMIHSVPKFPGIGSYSFPDSGHRNGQHFLCVSFDYQQLKTIARQLAVGRPYVYSHTFPEWLAASQPELYSVVNNKLLKQIPKTSVGDLSSAKGQKFVHFSKSSKFGKDLYAAFVAPHLQANVFVETWSIGSGHISSSCTIKYKVFDITQIELQAGGSKHYWKTTKDHSKWAITDDNSSSFVTCLGDINREKGQFKRGGGTLCLSNNSVWRLFRKMIADYQHCK